MQLLMPACETLIVCPPMARLPVRAVVLPLLAMENVTDPLPDPPAPGVTVSQVEALCAVHEHADAAVTVTVEVPADAPTETFGGDT